MRAAHLAFAAGPRMDPVAGHIQARWCVFTQNLGADGYFKRPETARRI
jgi:hypothetical protein